MALLSKTAEKFVFETNKAFGPKSARRLDKILTSIQDEMREALLDQALEIVQSEISGLVNSWNREVEKLNERINDVEALVHPFNQETVPLSASVMDQLASTSPTPGVDETREAIVNGDDPCATPEEDPLAPAVSEDEDYIRLPTQDLMRPATGPREDDGA